MPFELDPAAEQALRAEIAVGMADLGYEVAAEIAARAPSRRGRYRRSIMTSTYAEGQRIAGPEVRNLAKVGKAEVQTIVYTTSPLGHILERGTQAHDIPIEVEHGPFALKIIHHPGSRRFPHFGPGALGAVSQIGRLLASRLGRRYG